MKRNPVLIATFYFSFDGQKRWSPTSANAQVLVKPLFLQNLPTRRTIYDAENEERKAKINPSTLLSLLHLEVKFSVGLERFDRR